MYYFVLIGLVTYLHVALAFADVMLRNRPFNQVEHSLMIRFSVYLIENFC